MILGLLGGGQLGKMLALAGYPLGLRFRSFDLSPEAPTAHLTDLVIADYNDLDALERFASGLDLVTYEFENVPVASARFLSERVPVYPSPDALEVSQDRLAEKNFFRELGIPTPAFVQVDARDDLLSAIDRIGLPSVLKTRRFGYDGKGQFVLRKSEEVEAAWQALSGVPLLLEEFVFFEREVTIICARGRSGESAFYPLVENHHSKGILRFSQAPAPGLTPALQFEAEDYAARVLESIDYFGVLAIEFFQREGRLLVNEMAPRVHNSGHWTIEGAETSQFENHLRAILGLPLGSTAPVERSAMVNLIGAIPDLREVLSIQGAHLHLYGKAARPNRKLGHVTLRAPQMESLTARLARLRALVEPPG